MELEGGRERDSRATGESGGEGRSGASVLKRGRERARRRENKRNKLIRWRKGVSGGRENYCT